MRTTPGSRLSRFLGRGAVFGGAAAGAFVVFILVWPRVSHRKWVRSLTRDLEVSGNEAAVKVAGSRIASLYFNLSLLKHVGRRSGREYATPLSAYPLGDGFVLALVRPDVAWARNVLAAGKCSLVWRGHEYALANPEMIPASQALQAYPLPVRLLSRAQGTTEYLWLHGQT